ncbi:MAG: hypothetical protein LBI87_00415 [Candidatus Accumulibacter sp.]|nr:hypothetical protein [Accumulibacter sp.]
MNGGTGSGENGENAGKGSGSGLVMGALAGSVVDPVFGSSGMAMMSGGLAGLALGSCAVAASGRRSSTKPDSVEPEQ